MHPSPCSRLHDFDKSLGTILCFLEEVLLKDHLEGKKSYTKIYLLTLLYTTKLEEGSLEVDGYVKSMEAIWRRLDDVNLKLPEELVVLATLMVLPPSSGTQRIILKLPVQERPATRSFETQS
jgi:hypothetical protein